MANDPIVLHHYDRSPFAEKARVMLGIKGLDWRSVEIPVVMPKPDLMPLTGGYRKTPVMQIGADIYCDTQCICDELEARSPSPSLYPEGEKGAAMGVLRWSESTFFRASVGSAIAEVIDQLPDSFIADRTEFSGAPFTAEMLKAAQPHAIGQWRTFMTWVDAQLADGRAFFFGDTPNAVDASLFMHVWFTRAVAEKAGAGDFGHIAPWAERVADIGHGSNESLAGPDALDMAADGSPADPQGEVRATFSAGAAVTVTPDDSGRVPVAGKLARADDERITIIREDERVGEVAVHFPRAGFVIAPQD